jgi:hypothetical protein
MAATARVGMYSRRCRSRKVTEIGRGDRAAGRTFRHHMQAGVYFRLLLEALTLAIHEAPNLR